MTPSAVSEMLQQALEEMLPNQVMDPSRADHGAWINPALGLPDPSHVGAAALSCMAVLAARSDDLDDDRREDYLSRACAALAYLSRARRESGLVDLVVCNPDSSPDTAFILQLLGGTLLLEETRPSGRADAAAWNALARDFIRESAPAVARGGFHTPNHRWVISSALALALHLEPSLREAVAPAIAAYLAEGIDLDPDGFYLERSIGTYDGVTNRSLLLLHHCGFGSGLVEDVCRNLETDLLLLNADGTADTRLSIRQDRGQRKPPLPLFDSLLGAGVLAGRPEFLSAAGWLWSRSAHSVVRETVFWVAWSLEFYRPTFPVPPVAPTPSRYWKVFPTRRAARYRHEALTASFTDGPGFFSVCRGDVEIVAVQFFQAMQGVGAFVPTRLDWGERRVRWEMNGHFERRPGYELPLGRPVPWDRWEESKAERALRLLPPLDAGVEAACEGEEIRLRFQTGPGQPPGLLAQAMLDVPAGLILETDSVAFALAAGQEVFLEAGEARLRSAHHALRIGPGHRAHRAWSLRDTAPIPAGLARLIIPFLTPVDHEIRFRGESALGIS